ncbi:S8 family serine peptidase [Algoriphagus limi]|uniref:S8 family serine peptidase n=1 Tax=Algoriphagus limi TaxID=2975273 RepID=A0ABT2G841_9BACT|nr:S8 family serine peptidase [Algoriphagus limi]MCS5490180.1 S8 family serine peptidase [Algoriphagus limi]
MIRLGNNKSRLSPFLGSLILLLFAVSCEDSGQMEPKLDTLSKLGENTSNVVPGRYIVTLNSNEINFRKSDKYEDVQAGMRKIANDILVRYDVDSDKIKSVYGHALTGFTLDLTEEEFEVIRKDPKVKSIEPDHEISYYNQRKTPPGKDQPGDDGGGDGGGEPSDPGTGGTIQIDAPKYLDRIDQRQLPFSGTYTYNETGSGVTAYIPVGGIWDMPEEFENRAVTIDLIGEGEDLNGSTTNMALNVGGTSYGPAKGVNLVGVRTNDTCCDEIGYLSSLLAAYDWILANGQRPGIVLVGLVGPLENTAYFTVIENLYNAGFSLISSSGAWRENACTWASSYKPYIFTVGLATIEDRKQISSNYGDCIDLFTTTTDWSETNGGYVEIWRDGFNMNPNFVAAGVAAGVAAKFLENNPMASPTEVYQFLKNTSTKNVVSFSNSVNNHMLYSGMSMDGTGSIDPNRVNYVLDITGKVSPMKRNEYQILLNWQPIKNESGTVDIYENGLKIASTDDGYLIGDGFWVRFISGRNLAPKSYKICISGTNQCSNEVTLTF